MDVTRRDFLKVTGATACAGYSGLFGKLFHARADDTRLRIKYAKQTTTICPYCGCGCGQIVSAQGGKVVNIEGDPDHPINEGSLCAKGGALYQVANNSRRLETVRYRAPNSDHWEEKSWNWAINRISQLVKETRDAGLAETAKKNPGKSPPLNRIDTIAALGGASLDTEECYVYSKLMRALGVVYIEHQARI
jgi:anaerobic selenocysteine-containing dehydrogenase